VFFGLITILFGWLFIRGNRQEDEMRRIEKEQQQIKLNYLDRFAKASEERHSLRETLSAEIGSLKVDVLDAISGLRTDVSLTVQTVQELKKEHDRNTHHGN